MGGGAAAGNTDDMAEILEAMREDVDNGDGGTDDMAHLGTGIYPDNAAGAQIAATASPDAAAQPLNAAQSPRTGGQPPAQPAGGSPPGLAVTGAIPAAAWANVGTPRGVAPQNGGAAAAAAGVVPPDVAAIAATAAAAAVAAAAGNVDLTDPATAAQLEGGIYPGQQAAPPPPRTVAPLEVLNQYDYSGIVLIIRTELLHAEDYHKRKDFLEQLGPNGPGMTTTITVTSRAKAVDGIKRWRFSIANVDMATCKKANWKNCLLKVDLLATLRVHASSKKQQPPVEAPPPRAAARAPRAPAPRSARDPDTDGDEDAEPEDPGDLPRAGGAEEDETVEDEHADATAAAAGWRLLDRASMRPLAPVGFVHSDYVKDLKLLYGDYSPAEIAWLVHEGAFEKELKELNECVQRERAELDDDDDADLASNSITMERFLVYKGLRLAMSLVQQNTEDSYWYNAGRRGAISYSDFREVMPLREYRFIRRYVRYANPETDYNADDPTWKVKPVMNAYRAFSNHLFADPENPGKLRAGQYLCVDEARMQAGMKRAPAIRVLISKPIQRGWTLWMLCDCETGMIIDFWLDESYTLNKDMVRDKPWNYWNQIVLDFADKFVAKGHCFIADRLFNSFVLAHELKRRNDTRIIGTWDARFGMPAELKGFPKKPTARCPKGTWRMVETDGIFGHCFMDNARCFMIDTMVGGSVELLARRQRRAGHSTAGEFEAGGTVGIEGPSCNITYQNKMPEVDAKDQIRCHRKGFGAVELTRRCTKWTDKFDDGMFDVGEVIAMTLHDTVAETKVPHHEQMLQTHEFFISAANWYKDRPMQPKWSQLTQLRRQSRTAPATVAATKPPTPSKAPAPTPEMTAQHRNQGFMRRDKPKEAKKLKARQEKIRRGEPVRGSGEIIIYRSSACAMCALEGKKSHHYTTNCCLDCKPHVALHPACFLRYHSKLAAGQIKPKRAEKSAPLFVDSDEESE